MNKKQGFTLIELLVVVLIIGILSAVALPQYTKAVEKSRASEAITMLKTLREQQALCFLANGEADFCMQGDGNGNNLFTVMDVELTGEVDLDCGDPVCGPATKDFTYILDGQFIGAWRRPVSSKYYLQTTALPGDDQRISCGNYDANKNWCKVIGFTK